MKKSLDNLRGLLGRFYRNRPFAQGRVAQVQPGGQTVPHPPPATAAILPPEPLLKAANIDGTRSDSVPQEGQSAW